MPIDLASKSKAAEPKVNELNHLESIIPPKEYHVLVTVPKGAKMKGYKHYQIKKDFWTGNIKKEVEVHIPSYVTKVT